MCDFYENIPKTDEELSKMIMNGAEDIIFHDKERGFAFMETREILGVLILWII